MGLIPVPGTNDLQPFRRHSVLVLEVLDDSTSMRRDIPTMIDAINRYTGELQKSGLTNILLARWAFNSGKLAGYVPPRRIPSLLLSDFELVGRTPLYQATWFALNHALRKAQEYDTNESDTLTYTRIHTDGRDNSSKVDVSEVRELITSMFATGKHIVQGFGYGSSEDFHRIFQQMGIPKEHIFVVTDTTPENVRDTVASAGATSITMSISRESFEEYMRTGQFSDQDDQ